MNHRILIVDDERRTLLLMERALRDLQDEHQDIEILTASNGEEALTLIESDKPELVYLDIMMPHVNGLDVCKSVKSRKETQNIFVVMLTAMGQEGDKQNAKDAGADLYLTKPFDPDELLDLAEQVLGM